jgi:hypothetical protein
VQPPPEVLAELVAREQIRETLARIARGIDRGDTELRSRCYHPDAVVSAGFLERGGGAIGPSPFAATPLAFHHHLGGSVIDIDGEAATSETYLYAIHRFDVDGQLIDFEARCRYLDNWERRDDGPFKIARRMIVFDWARTDKVEAEWPPPDGWQPKLEPGGATFERAQLYWGAPTREMLGEHSNADPSYQVLGALLSLGALARATDAGDAS